MEKTQVALKAGVDAGFVNWMKILLDPWVIVQQEKKFARLNEADYKIDEGPNTTKLTVKSKARGDFRNTYALNKSIPESNNRRVYTFDNATNYLKSFDVYIDSAGKEVHVIELKSIDYNQPISQNEFSIALPSSVKWVTVKDIFNHSGIAGLTGEKVAKMFWDACHNEDWKTVRQLIPGFINFVQLEFAVKSEYGGLTVISIGKSFKSGLYPGELVPYTIRKKNGSVKTWNLAVRNDNPQKKWYVDGGF